MILTAIDTETTGLEAGFHEICSLSAISFDTDSWTIKTEFKINIRPVFIHRVDQLAMEVNGFTVDELKTFTKVNIAKSKFMTWYQNSHTEKLIPVAHNWAFDKSFLEAWFGRDVYEGIFNYQPYCTKSMANFLKLKGKIPKEVSSSLESLTGHFGIPHDPHNAHSDAYCCMLVLKEMLSL